MEGRKADHQVVIQIRVHVSGGPANVRKAVTSAHSTPQSREFPWSIREPDTRPVHQKPSQSDPKFPVQCSPPQYSAHPPSQQRPFRAIGEAGGIPPTQNVPPSGHLVPLSPNDHFPTPNCLGRPSTTRSGGSIPVYVGSTVFPSSLSQDRSLSQHSLSRLIWWRGGQASRKVRFVVDHAGCRVGPSQTGELPPCRRPVESSKLHHSPDSVQGVHHPERLVDTL